MTSCGGEVSERPELSAPSVESGRDEEPTWLSADCEVVHLSVAAEKKSSKVDFRSSNFEAREEGKERNDDDDGT